MTDVEISGADIDGLAVTLAPGSTVSGSVIFENKTAAAVPPRVMVRLIPAQTTRSMNPSQFLTTGDKFSIAGVVPGRFRVDASIFATLGTPTWFVKAAIVNGRDVADGMIDIHPGENIDNVIVTMSDAMASVTGTLYDAASKPSSDLSMVLFSTDRAHWYQGARRLRAPLRPSSDGRFTFTGLPPGEYYLAALNDFEPNEWLDPEFLAQAAAGAITISLREGERKTQDIKIGR